jgi:hypothetical protein
VADRRHDLGDLALYGLSVAFAGVTALTSTLVPHRVWGQFAFFGYLLALLFVVLPLRRVWLAFGTWLVVAWLPLILEASVLPHRQEEVTVVEQAGWRLLHTGTPYLSRSSIASLPVDERLLGYTPYQPGMAVFGLPRALLGSHWWTDARVGFGLVMVVCLVLAPWSLRVVQMATVLPLSALTLATGGDDIPVLALSLLAFWYASRDRHLAAGVAIGLAGALKLFAWPVALVLLVFAWRRGSLARFSWPALGIPFLVLVPALVISASAFVENVIRFPGGGGLVVSPAQSPLLGRLIAVSVPGGHALALGLLAASGLAIVVWLVRRPLRGVADAALVSAVGLTAAIVLNPTTRFGYFLYPVAYLAVWYTARRSGSVTLSAAESLASSSAAGSPSSAAGSPSSAAGSPSSAPGSPSSAAGSPSPAAGSPSPAAGSSSAGPAVAGPGRTTPVATDPAESSAPGEAELTSRDAQSGRTQDT